MSILGRLFSLLLSAAFMFPGAATAAGYSLVDTEFDISVNAVSGGVDLAFSPNYTGTTEDGFVVVFRENWYFLPEGQKLRISDGRRYDIVVARAFWVTEKGFLIGETQPLTVNGSPYATTGTSLPLQKLTSVYSWMLPVKLVANFNNKMNASLAVSPYVYQGPPVHYDDIELVFSGGPRSGIPTKTVSLPSQGGTIPILLERNYVSVSARGRVVDERNGRIIQASRSTLEFSVDYKFPFGR